jgi:hemerythrin-like metal-binding protein
MTLVYWRDDCKVNHSQMDREHHETLQILEDLYRSILVEQDNQKIQSKLDQLFSATLEHCEVEEVLMDIYNYPDRTIHIEEHESVLSQIFNVRLAFEQHYTSLSLDLIHELTTWINQHVCDYDLKMVRFIQQCQQNEELYIHHEAKAELLVNVM